MGEDGKKVPRARVALFKRDDESHENDDEEVEELTKAIQGKTQGGVTFPKSDFAYTPIDDKPNTWKLRLTKTPGGKPDSGIVGAASAALGKGFRGNRVVIPSGDRPAVIARVRSAWKQANEDRDEGEMPEVLKGESGTMTLEQIEKKLTDQEGVISVLKRDNDFFKTERELVLKMSKKERRAYAAMTDEEQKAFMAADDNKRKAMCDKAEEKIKEASLVSKMTAVEKSEYDAAGPTRRVQILKEKAQSVGEEDEGVLVLGTHDLVRAQALADEVARSVAGSGFAAVNPWRGWWRDGFECGRRAWVIDEVHGRAGVLFRDIAEAEFRG